MKIENVNELQVGMRITVQRWTSHQDRSYCGDVLEVMVVDLPFIVVRNVSEKIDFMREPFSLNTNDVELKCLSPEYINALVRSEEATQ